MHYQKTDLDLNFLQAGAVTPINDTLYIFMPKSGGPCNESMEFNGKHLERPEIKEVPILQSPPASEGMSDSFLLSGQKLKRKM